MANLFGEEKVGRVVLKCMKSTSQKNKYQIAFKVEFSEFPFYDPPVSRATKVNYYSRIE